MISPIGCTCNDNKSGPSTDPCSTHVIKLDTLLADHVGKIPANAVPLCRVALRDLSCQILRSVSTTIVPCRRSGAVLISLTTHSRAVSVEWFRLYAD